MIKKRKISWKTLGSSQVFKNNWLRLREDKVITPEGKNSTYGVVTIPDGVMILALDNYGYIYLIKEYRYPLKGHSYELCGGGVEEGETPLQAAKKELKEEMGLMASKWIDMGVTDPMTAHIDTKNHLFIAKGLTLTPRQPTPNETMEVLRVSMDEAMKWAISGKVNHAVSALLILKAYVMEQENINKLKEKFNYRNNFSQPSQSI